MGFLHTIKTLRNLNWRQLKANLIYLSNHSLYNQYFDDAYKIKDEVLEECVLEFDRYKSQLRTLNILDAYDTVTVLQQNPKSFSRYGDGEIHIIQGKDQPFQKYEPRLAEKLQQFLSGNRDDVYIGLNRAYFQSPLDFSERNRRFYRVRGTEYRRFFVEHCHPDNVYLDASCFGAYFRFGDDFNYKEHYARIQELFAGKKIAIVSGEGVFEKLEYNVFSKAESQMIVHGPRINAFSEYDSLIDKIVNTVPKDHLLCIILGQTATVLVPDLTDLGYMAWDVGHVAKDYDAYMKGMEKNEANTSSFWAPD